METDNLNFIPNEPGLPATDKSSQRIENAIEKWKAKEDRRTCKSYRGMSYWETVSSCKSL